MLVLLSRSRRNSNDFSIKVSTGTRPPVNRCQYSDVTVTVCWVVEPVSTVT